MTSRTCFVMLAVLFCCAVAVSNVAAADAREDRPTRPNILYFYVDDMGWGSIGPNGQAARKAKGQPYVRTPNLDRLAAEGWNFRRGYGCHVCSPARSSQQSGFHQGHTFADRNDPDNAKKAMRADDILMGDALSAAAYVTGYWGKWGYGGSKDHDNPVIENVQTLPTSHGYQHVLAELHHVRAHTFFQPTLWSAPAKGDAVGGLELVKNSLARIHGDEAYPNEPALQNHPGYPKTAYCDDAYAFAALDFVREQGQNYNKTGQPFFGLLAVQIPHAPFQEIATLPKWDEAYVDVEHFPSLAKQSQQWAAMVTRIDAHFGNILAALEDPNNDGDISDSVAGNTLVIFQSDNGGPRGSNNTQFDANGGLRGNKGSIQEGGIRVPLVMRWPAKISDESKFKAGSNCPLVVDVTDLLPTFCELAGAPVPLGVDGVSIAPTLLGEGHQRRRDFLIHEAGNGQSIIRGKRKLVRGKGGRVQLFDLETDHSETDDIAAKHPRLVKELRALLLDERVDEPKGFAVTYHHWLGKDGGDVARAANWSNYRYANAGITYMTDDGPPRLSWVAHMTNSKAKPNTAHVESNAEFLALQIGGDESGPQSLVVAPDAHLTGRNEIRLAPNGVLNINGGKVSTLRWVDIFPGGKLQGHGVIEGILYNDGSMEVGGSSESQLQIVGDYHQTAGAKLSISHSGDDAASLVILGDALLDGTLQVAWKPKENQNPDSALTILSAKTIDGRFNNPHDEVVTADGRRFAIVYGANTVRLAPKPR